MKRIILLASMLFFSGTLLIAQSDSALNNVYFNSAEKLLMTKGNLKIGGYGGVHYNQPLSSETRENGKLDVHRFIMMMGYQFNDRTQFVTELEFEHVKEIYVEQAFLQYKLNDFMNLRAGLILTPMGIVNEYHEPTVYHGVERPVLDHDIVPSTWREIGVGFYGLVLPASLKYQVYMMNGFNSFDGEAQIGGDDGMRGGRQKAAESFVSAPNLAAKVEYFGIRGLNLGLAGYFGKTQSTLYDGVAKDDDIAMATADSSVVGISMLGADARYSMKGWKVAAQLYYTSLSNTEEYNEFTANKGGGDLGSSMFGYYVDLGYNVLRNTQSEKQLIPFVRYSNFDTHRSVPANIAANNAYQRDIITTGLSLYLDKGAVLKADMQFVKDGASDEYSTTFNAGFGIMF
ncbi:MAG TPA: hypothetical protein VJ939_07530 [Bacteroidales bacterium]|nr:hypothetical protein [Bacteroidales bacterium]